MPDTVPTSLFLTGGARSGKSRLAQAWVLAGPLPHVYVATAEPHHDDPEMQTRIARHQADRAGRGWTTRECATDVAAAIAAAGAGAVVVDCVTLWLCALGGRHAWAEAPILAEVDRLAALLADPPCDVAVVSNEVGSGIVPGDALSRGFQDLQGFANQRLAAAAHAAALVVAGLPLWLKHPTGVRPIPGTA